MDYLRVRLSEPCNRGTLKGAHLASVFMQTVTGVAVPGTYTNSTSYHVVYKELLSAAVPGRNTKQDPRMFVPMLGSSESLVCNNWTSPYFRFLC